MTDLFKYYGLDYVAMIMSLIAILLLGNKVKWGFVSFMFTNAAWITLGVILLHSYALIIGNTIFLITNTRGFIKWNQTKNKEHAKQ
jgi:hypothetical protein